MAGLGSVRRAAFDDLAAECSDVVVAGQSMGGTLALHLAAHDLRVRAVATLAAPIWLSGPLPPLLPLIKRVVRWHRAGDDVDLWHPDAVEELYSYGIRPTRSIDELRRLCAVVRNELAQVRAPVLVVHGERDRSIDPRCAREIARRLVDSEAVRLELLPRSGHAISVDVDRAERQCRDPAMVRAPRSGGACGCSRATMSQPESRRGFQQPRCELRVDAPDWRAAPRRGRDDVSRCDVAAPEQSRRAASRRTSPHGAQRSTDGDVPLPAYSRCENRNSPPHFAQRRRGSGLARGIVHHRPKRTASTARAVRMVSGG